MGQLKGFVVGCQDVVFLDHFLKGLRILRNLKILKILIFQKILIFLIFLILHFFKISQFFLNFFFHSRMIPGQSLILIPQIPKIPDGIHIKRIFPHTDSILLKLNFSFGLALIIFLGKTLQLVLQIFPQSPCSQSLVLMGGKRVVRHPIIPTHGFLAIILSLIKNTI